MVHHSIQWDCMRVHCWHNKNVEVWKEGNMVATPSWRCLHASVHCTVGPMWGVVCIPATLDLLEKWIHTFISCSTWNLDASAHFCIYRYRLVLVCTVQLLKCMCIHLLLFLRATAHPPSSPSASLESFHAVVESLRQLLEEIAAMKVRAWSDSCTWLCV